MRVMASALLAGFAVSLLWGVWSLQRQRALAEEVIRLHVIAASDGAADQRLKLQVRDAVLEETARWLDGADSREAAEELLRLHLPELRNAAAETVAAAGYDDPVEALLAPETYPTRDYGTFALPGGEYLSLRVIIGAGEGHNWWCVMFPPMCVPAADKKDEIENVFTEDEIKLVESSPKYEIRFKVVEICAEIKESLNEKFGQAR